MTYETPDTNAQSALQIEDARRGNAIADLLLITVENWAVYNPRTDRANHSWFRFQNNFYSDPKISILEPNERHVFIFLFCEASKCNGETFEIARTKTANDLKLTVSYLDNALKTLGILGVITTAEWRSDKKGTATKRRRNSSLQTDRQTDIHVIPEFLEIEEYLKARNLTKKQQEALLALYPQEKFLVQEFKKMKLWEASNPTRVKKSFARFATNWMLNANPNQAPKGKATNPSKVIML